MGLRVNTNIFSLTAQRNLANASQRLGGNYSKLASGLRITTAADDAAGLGISERMRSQIRALSAARRNAEDGVSLAQTAEGALNEVNANLTRMRELAIQSANGTYNAGDRAVLDLEFQELILEIDRISTSSTFNGISLLDSNGTVDIQVGIVAGEVITLQLVDATTGPTALALAGEAIDTVANASTSLAAIDLAIDTVVLARGSLGASQNRLLTAARSIDTARENLSASESRIRDVDVAAETADLSRNTILQQAATAVLAQANQQPQIALSLLQG